MGRDPLQHLVVMLAAAAVLGSMSGFTQAAGQCAEGDPTVTPCPSALAAAQALTGNNVQLPISNAVFSGACTVGGVEGVVLLNTMGCHELAPLMPLGALVLSTGDARIGATTSNTAAQKTLQQGGNAAINADLQAQSAAAGYQQQLHDQVLLQFDITPTASGALAFQYVFGSEEYPDFAASPAYPAPSAYNDIFGFFVWPAAGGAHSNVALLPNTSTPVSINSVNALASAYYVANDFGLGGTAAKKTELNGMTTLLKTVDYQVTAGTAYRVLLAIADGFDDGIDSVVWVKAGSVRFNIKDCVGSWTPRNGTVNLSCSGRCEGGPGLLSEVYIVTQQSQNGGLNCSVGNGTTRSNTTACVNSSPCPVNCTGSWVSNGANCTGACSGGSGFLPEVFQVSSPALYGGSCPCANGTTRATTVCVNNVPCPPRDCVGAWQSSGQCSGACGGRAGLLPELFIVTTSAAFNGTDCAVANATSRQTTPCNNTTPCPVPCVGQWTVPDAAACSGPCGNNSGFVPEMFAVSQPSLYGGVACGFANGTLRFQLPCLTAACPPVDCAGTWVAAGPCNAGCQMNGLLPEAFNVTVTAAYGGQACGFNQGALRLVTPCFNSCRDCVGSWTNVSCSGACQGGAGKMTQQFTITTAASGGGAPCNFTAGATRSDLDCINNAVCAVPCNGSWLPNGLCNGACSGGAGKLPEKFFVYAAAQNGGSCPATNGTTRLTTACTNTTPCPPVNCVGSWVNGSCNGTCGGGSGLLKQTFTITTAAAFNGTACPFAASAVQWINCTNAACCPVNCVGSWVSNGECNGSCSGGTGRLPERYHISVARACSGNNCPSANNTVRSTTVCVNNVPCPPRDCVGAWQSSGQCSGACGGRAGLLPELFIVTTSAAFNGTDCAVANATSRQTTPCNNTMPCPVPCVGQWTVPDAAACSGPCGNNSGFVPEMFAVSQPSLYGGVACGFANGTLRFQLPCLTAACPPVDCVGSWVQDGLCTGGCGGLRLGGILPEQYVITTQASHGGSDCPFIDGSTRESTPCTNKVACVSVACNGTYLPDGPCQAACQAAGTLPERYMVYANAVDGGNPCPAANQTTRNTTACMSLLPCPVDCLGSWVLADGCDAGCGNGAGNLTEQYIVTTPAAHNGSACLVADGSTRQVPCVNPTPCPVSCQGSWSASGACQNASCGGGQGLLPEAYIISVAEAWGGQACPFANRTQRLSTACTNLTRCEVPCVGSWVALSCSAACDDVGLTQLQFVVTTHAAYGGADCEAADGDTRSSGACAGPPCPVACQGSWQPSAACDAGCEASGIQPQVFVVQVAAAHGGSPCAYQANDTQSVVCVSHVMCPVNCTGAWSEVPGSCSAGCNSSGAATELYVVTEPAAHGGLDCPFASNVSQAVACVNATPCPLPVDCEGGWEWQSCSAACGQLGFDVNVFVVTQPAMFGGRLCPVRGGVKRLGAACTVECPSSPLPVDCSGRFAAAGACSALCGGADRGVIPMVFLVTTPASLGGAACATSNGSLKLEPCINSAACPWSDVQLLDSPPVLPPLPASLNDSDMRIKGGNVTISGIRIEGASGFSSSTAGSSSLTGSSTAVTSTADSGGSGNATSSKPLKPRACQFNGLLAFVTFGIVVEVLGEFELQRSMSWAWSTEWQAWVTQVGIRGLFVLTREDIQDNVTVGVQTLKPRVSGFLTLYSRMYPGPGFSGRYDWAGQLELTPDPFQEWADASSLLASAAPASGGNRRSLLQAAAANDTSTGQTPVQGRVAVKESRTLVDNSGAAGGVLALDDSGEVQLVCLSNCPDLGQPPLGSSEQQPGGGGGSTTAPSAPHTASPGGKPRLLIIIIAAIAAPSGLAVLVVIIVGAVLRHRRQRSTRQQQTSLHAGAIAARGAAAAAAGRSRRGWGSVDGRQGPAGPAQLDRESSDGVPHGADSVPGAAEANAAAARTAVERLRPGEAGFGSLPGGLPAMVTLPPCRDSVAGEYELHPGACDPERSRPSTRWEGVRSSFAGMASAVSQAWHHRSSRAGDAYRMQGDASGVQQSAPSFFTQFSRYHPGR